MKSLKEIKKVLALASVTLNEQDAWHDDQLNPIGPTERWILQKELDGIGNEDPSSVGPPTITTSRYQWSDGTIHDEPEPPGFVEVPPGSGNWEHTNENNPPGGQYYGGQQWIFNIYSGQYELIEWNPETNQWEYTHPHQSFEDWADENRPNSNGDPYEENELAERIGWGFPPLPLMNIIDGEWVEIYPPNVDWAAGGWQKGDLLMWPHNPADWPPCDGPAGGCINHNGDDPPVWAIWDGDVWVPWTPPWE